jgi:hypothetical protein
MFETNIPLVFTGDLIFHSNFTSARPSGKINEVSKVLLAFHKVP